MDATLAFAALWLALAASPHPGVPAAATATTPTPTPTAAAPGKEAPPPGPTEVSGAVVEVDLQRHRCKVQTAGGAVELGWDRNTLIYQPGGATTSRALQPGVVVRAGLDPAGTAYWIQVRPAPTSAPPAAPPRPPRAPGAP
jgi:hypothetical protein